MVLSIGSIPIEFATHCTGTCHFKILLTCNIYNWSHLIVSGVWLWSALEPAVAVRQKKRIGYVADCRTKQQWPESGTFWSCRSKSGKTFQDQDLIKFRLRIRHRIRLKMMCVHSSFFSQDRDEGVDKVARRKLILASVLCILFMIGTHLHQILALTHQIQMYADDLNSTRDIILKKVERTAMKYILASKWCVTNLAHAECCILFFYLFWSLVSSVVDSDSLNPDPMNPDPMNPDPEPAFHMNPDLDPGFWWIKIEKNIAEKMFELILFWSKIAIYLSLGLFKGRPIYRREKKRTSKASKN